MKVSEQLELIVIFEYKKGEWRRNGLYDRRDYRWK